MGIFIRVEIQGDKCGTSSSGCQECIRICPVDIFQRTDGKIVTVSDNEDECTLCYICMERCPAKAM